MNYLTCKVIVATWRGLKLSDGLVPAGAQLAATQIADRQALRFGLVPAEARLDACTLIKLEMAKTQERFARVVIGSCQSCFRPAQGRRRRGAAY